MRFINNKHKGTSPNFFFLWCMRQVEVLFFIKLSIFIIIDTTRCLNIVAWRLDPVEFGNKCCLKSDYRFHLIFNANLLSNGKKWYIDGYRFFGALFVFHTCFDYLLKLFEVCGIVHFYNQHYRNCCIYYCDYCNSKYTIYAMLRIFNQFIKLKFFFKLTKAH